MATNVAGTVNVVNSCAPGTRFVFVSSGAVYKPDVEPHGEFVSALEPSDIYGLTKLHGEQYVQALTVARQLTSCIVRLFNVIGRGDQSAPASRRRRPAAVRRQRPSGWETPGPKRDYVDVLDVAGGLTAVALGGNRDGVDCGS